VRRQQPLRLTGGFNKEMQIPLVSADAPIWSYELLSDLVAPDEVANVGRTYPLSFARDYADITTPDAQVEATNEGNVPSPARLTITGPLTNPTIRNETTGEDLVLTYTLGAGETLVVDMGARSVLLNGTANRYSAVNWELTDWWLLAPGSNDISFANASYSAGASLLIEWRHAWI
jgi:phage-related protein